MAEALEYARDGDTLVVWKLDRLGRSLKHLIETVNALAARKVGFQSLQESMDTTTSGGKLIFHVFGALAEFERELIRERVLVQREIENWRSPLARIPPSSAGQLGEHRATQVATAETGRRLNCNWFQERKKHVGWSAVTQPAWVEETNWLGKKTVTA